MALTAKESGSDFQKVPEGIHQAICIGMFDIGTKHDEKWKKDIHKVIIMWELPQERITIEGKDKPMAISKKYTLSLSEKSNLRKDLQAWRGKAFTAEQLAAFDVFKVLGVGCQLQVIHSDYEGKTYANVAAIMALPKGTVIGKPENPIRRFSFEEYDHSMHLDDEIPEWIRKQIEESDEYKRGAAPADADLEVPEEHTDLDPF